MCQDVSGSKQKEKGGPPLFKRRRKGRSGAKGGWGGRGVWRVERRRGETWPHGRNYSAVLRGVLGKKSGLRHPAPRTGEGGKGKASKKAGKVAVVAANSRKGGTGYNSMEQGTVGGEGDPLRESAGRRGRERASIQLYSWWKHKWEATKKPSRQKRGESPRTMRLGQPGKRGDYAVRRR